MGIFQSISSPKTKTKREKGNFINTYTMAHADPFSMSRMLDTLQYLRFAAARETIEEENPAVPPPESFTPPKETMIEWVSERSSEKYEQVEAMEMTQEVVEEDWIGDLMDIYATKGFKGVLMMINTEDQQQQLISLPSHVNVSPACLGDNSLPIELDQEWKQEFDAAFLAFTRDEEEEDDPNMQWMDQD